MLNTTDFFKKFKLPILWTIGYVFTVWIVLHILFNFELFSIQNWVHVSRAHLHGLGGFTFCLIVFAIIPLYIATMIITIRTQKPLLTIPVPKFISKMIKQETKQNTVPEPEPTPETQQTLATAEQTRFPAEMRGAVTNARNHPDRINTPICGACSINANIYPNKVHTPAMPTELNNEIPLPSDFDTDFDNTSSQSMSSAPIFQDINFYDDDNANDDTPETINDITNSVTEYFKKTNRQYTIQSDDIIVTDNAAIAIHDDNDFWIMDEPTWFAAGKTRKSPIPILLDIAKQNGIVPTLFLCTTNIMNLDAKRTEWENAGIKVVTNPQDL